MFKDLQNLAETQINKIEYILDFLKDAENNLTEIERLAIEICHKLNGISFTINNSSESGLYFSSNWLSDLYNFFKDKKQKTKYILEGNNIWETQRYNRFYEKAKIIMESTKNYESALEIVKGVL
jgi:hypothetical protein